VSGGVRVREGRGLKLRRCTAETRKNSAVCWVSKGLYNYGNGEGGAVLGSGMGVAKGLVSMKRCVIIIKEKSTIKRAEIYFSWLDWVSRAGNAAS
jgi:hypothetical protein